MFDRRGISLSAGRVSLVCTVLAALAFGPFVSVGFASPESPETPAAKAPTTAEAQAFVEQAEQNLLKLWVESEHAGWVQSTYITYDTEILSAKASERVLGAAVRYAKEATRFDGLDLPYDTRRKLELLKRAITVPAPEDAAKREELTRLASKLEGEYGKGKYCPKGDSSIVESGKCLDLTQLSNILADSRDPQKLEEAWVGWRTISPKMRDDYARFIQLGDEGAVELGYKDVGAMWRSGYDMDPDAFATELDRLWGQVKPLYDSLYCYVRRKLNEQYGDAVVPLDQPIPADLLGNMWSQDWSNIYPLVAPPEADSGYDLTELLLERETTPVQMVKYGEGFFTSLGFDPLPETFWERSMFTKPRDRDVVCHASAWDVDEVNDLRIKMCIQINAEDFSTIHHELGHNFYQRAYNQLSPLYRDSANDGFHEGIGDTIALSVTPSYLVKIGLLDKEPPTSGDLGYLMRRALDKVAFLPFGLLIDQWRWQVYSGEIAPENYNAGWWALREKYQGIRPPVARSEADFDPGAKYHVPASVPYTRYFLADILQFQFHRALCQAAGYKGPLYRCSIYGNKEAGAKLIKMLEMGQSRPWQDALEVLTGQREMDATAILDYFAPLKTWLDQQNGGRCGG